MPRVGLGRYRSRCLDEASSGSSAIRTEVGGRVCSTSFLRMARNPFPIRFLGESSGIESNAMPLAPGEQLGHYKIQSPIGRGGMSEACITIRAKIC